MSTRYACCLVPQFPIALWAQEEPLLASLPLAIAETTGESSALTFYNTSAEQAGVTSDMTVAQAHVACPNLLIKVRNEQQEKIVSRDIVKILQTLSPFVEETVPGQYYLNASGLRFIYDSEATFARQIIATLHSTGLPVQVGVAANKFVAQVAAQTAAHHEPVLVSSGTERLFVAPLSINYLPVTVETRQSLYELGLRTIGQLASLPLNELMERFASDGLVLSRLANGTDPAFFLPDIPPELLSRKIPLSFSLFNTQTLLLYVEHLLESLVERLRQAGRCCSVCLVECHLEDKTTLTLKATLDQPGVTAAPFMRQLRQLSESTELTAGITDIAVIIPETAVLILEQLAFQKHAIGTATQDTDSRMAKLAQQANLFQPELQQAHLPEQNFRLIPATVKRGKTPSPHDSPQPYTGRELWGFRLLQPPMIGDVVSAGHGAVLFYFKKKVHRVKQKAGPWKLSGGWWSDVFDRLYYEIHTTERKVYLVYFDRLTARWFVQGVFD